MFAGNEPLNNSPLTQDQATDQDTDQARLEAFAFCLLQWIFTFRKRRQVTRSCPWDRVVALSLELE